jgi:hypothetical protein
MVGTAFCLGLEDSEICRLIEGLKMGVDDLCRADLAHDEHIQAASLRPKPDSKRGKEFIVSGVCWRGCEESRMISRSVLRRRNFNPISGLSPNSEFHAWAIAIIGIYQLHP